MALCMPLGCFELRPLFPLIRFLVAITAIALAPLVTVGAVAESLWQSGVFPIVQFEGYSSHFGHRLGISGNEELHTGLDIAAPLGSPVLSWWSGEVVEIIDDSICGLGVVIVSGGLRAYLLPSAAAVLASRPEGAWGAADREGWCHWSHQRSPSALGHSLSR